MISRLRGTVVGIEDDEAAVETGGVAYQVFCHLRTLMALQEREGGEVTLHVHMSVSDDAIRLFGFLSREELRLFRQLIGVERIGPKAALGILGRAELPVLVRAIRSGDSALVATVPGIGRKTAERVILELRDKLDRLALPGDGPASAPSPDATSTSAVHGLVGLGFREADAIAAVASALAEAGPGAGTGAVIGAALRRLDRVPA